MMMRWSFALYYFFNFDKGILDGTYSLGLEKFPFVIPRKR
jgi:hypothetical protein